MGNYCFSSSSKEENFGKGLQKNGHKCVFYLETLPLQVSWCGNSEKCVFSGATDKISLEDFLKIQRFSIKT